MSRFLGIDIGTTYLKGAVLDLEAGTISLARRAPMPAPVEGLPATRYELDPEAVRVAVRGLIAGLVREAGDAAGLVMCSQMHGLVLLDECGRPRSNIITWKDQRAREPAANGTSTWSQELASLVTVDRQFQIGGELRVGVPVTALYCLRQEGALPDGVYAASLPDFIASDLCGTEPATDPTIAAAQGLLDVERGDWHRPLIERLGFDRLRWPRIQRSGERVGAARIEGQAIPCFTPIGDQQCALLGTQLRERELSLNISTGSQASLLCRTFPTRTSSGEGISYQVRPYFDGKWLKTIVSVPAGRSLGLLVDLLMEMGRAAGQDIADPWDYIRKAVDRVASTDLEVDLSFFASLTGDRGRIANIGEGNFTVGHLFAAAFRAMAANYARCERMLVPNREWDRVVFSGGLAQGFPRLRQEILDAVGAPSHRLCPEEEDALAGLLEFARACVFANPSTIMSA